ncbi:antibiotic biosynthesis monooxygenase family protein [Neolewinella persica]|uniref:antibiotic biosynthesis monooxygenase family protein n=1 Tax=Neolewinella persica TaxID=70998 RepID=UPI00037026B2|nr:antibiotic biosynthesis monooxygenase family protein [Neolewinella persica]
MILEHVHITIAPNRIAEYLKAFGQARPLVQVQPGCHSCRLLPALGEPGSFLLLIEWESKEDHTEGFRKSREYQEWSRLLHPFYEVFPEVNYFTIPA